MFALLLIAAFTYEVVQKSELFPFYVDHKQVDPLTTDHVICQEVTDSHIIQLFFCIMPGVLKGIFWLRHMRLDKVTSAYLAGLSRDACQTLRSAPLEGNAIDGALSPRICPC